MAKSFKCSKCDRKFSMAANLGRHMSTIHSSKAARKTAATRPKNGRRRNMKGAGAGSVRRAGRGRALARGVAGDVSTRVIGELQAYHGDLLGERVSLDARIGAVARAMAELGAAAPAGPAKRMKRAKTKVKAAARVKMGRPPARGARPGSLRDYIVRVLRQKTTGMSPRDIGASVVKAGFKTKAKDITKAVSNTLPQVRGVKKVGFGIYKLGTK